MNMGEKEGKNLAAYAVIVWISCCRNHHTEDCNRNDFYVQMYTQLGSIAFLMESNVFSATTLLRPRMSGQGW